MEAGCRNARAVSWKSLNIEDRCLLERSVIEGFARVSSCTWAGFVHPSRHTSPDRPTALSSPPSLQAIFFPKVNILCHNFYCQTSQHNCLLFPASGLGFIDSEVFVGVVMAVGDRHLAACVQRSAVVIVSPRLGQQRNKRWHWNQSQMSQDTMNIKRRLRVFGETTLVTPH